MAVLTLSTTVKKKTLSRLKPLDGMLKMKV